MDKYIYEKKTPITLIAFLADKYPEMSKKAIKRAIEQGCCVINGKVETFSTHSLSNNDKISFRMPIEKKRVGPTPILYEDEEIVVFDKPCGLICHEDTLKILLPKNQSFLVHRLDKETSGVWMVAKTEKAYRLLWDLFAARKIEKIYIAHVVGRLEKKEGIITNYLGVKENYQGQKKYGAVKASIGKEATTRYKKIACNNDRTLVELYPETGRTHQLRVHMAGLNHPILGDLLYGVKWGEKIAAPRLMLHAKRLAFIHPENARNYEFISAEPHEFII